MEKNNIQKVPSNHMMFQLSLLYLHIETFFFPWPTRPFLSCLTNQEQPSKSVWLIKSAWLINVKYLEHESHYLVINIPLQQIKTPNLSNSINMVLFNC